MCVTDRHDLTLAVKLVLGRNTTNQLIIAIGPNKTNFI